MVRNRSRGRGIYRTVIPEPVYAWKETHARARPQTRQVRYVEARETQARWDGT